MNRLPPDPVIEAYKKHVDRTLLRENLKLTVTQRLEKLMELQRFAEELRRAGAAARLGASPMPQSTYEQNRSRFSEDQLREFDRKWVAFAPDGSRVVASAETLLELEQQVTAAGEDLGEVGLEWIEFRDFELGGAELL